MNQQIIDRLFAEHQTCNPKDCYTLDLIQAYKELFGLLDRLVTDKRSNSGTINSPVEKHQAQVASLLIDVAFTKKHAGNSCDHLLGIDEGRWARYITNGVSVAFQVTYCPKCGVKL